MKLSTQYTEQYLTPQEYEDYAKNHENELKIVDENLYHSDMLDWVHVDEWADGAMCTKIEELAAEIRENAEVLW